MEVNFLPVFLAAALVPEVSLRDRWSMFLMVPTFGIAILMANATAPLRLAIGIIPLHFVINLTKSLRSQGRDLIPPNLAYRTLQLFVLVSFVQTIDFNYVHFIPDAINQSLAFILPRYSGSAYDEAGIQGVQGWASEPSSAAVSCIGFSLVSIVQVPGRRWHVLSLYLLLTLVNKSIYSLVLLILLAMACLAISNRLRNVLLLLIPMSAIGTYIISHSKRILALQSNLLVEGIDRSSSRELARFTQIFYPLQQFPSIYKPPLLFGDRPMEPMGLLPLVVGYGSIFGLMWIIYVLRRNFPLSRVKLLPTAAVAALVLLMMTAPDLIPAVVTLSAFAVNPDGAAPFCARIAATGEEAIV